MKSPEVLSSVWLVPVKKDETDLSKVIKGLSQRHNSAPFLPHITIYGEVAADIQEVEDAALSAIGGFAPFTVEKERLDYSSEWSKTLFVQIRPSKILSEIHRRLRERLIEHCDYVLNPHISLVYKEEMTKEEKLQEIPNLTIPDLITIDRVAITFPQNPIEKSRDVASWQTLFVARIGS